MSAVHSLCHISACLLSNPRISWVPQNWYLVIIGAGFCRPDCSCYCSAVKPVKEVLVTALKMILQMPYAQHLFFHRVVLLQMTVGANSSFFSWSRPLQPYSFLISSDCHHLSCPAVVPWEYSGSLGSAESFPCTVWNGIPVKNAFDVFNVFTGLC